MLWRSERTLLLTHPECQEPFDEDHTISIERALDAIKEIRAQGNPFPEPHGYARPPASEMRHRMAKKSVQNAEGTLDYDCAGVEQHLQFSRNITGHPSLPSPCKEAVRATFCAAVGGLTVEPQANPPSRWISSRGVAPLHDTFARGRIPPQDRG
jgi:hypothetical protein